MPQEEVTEEEGAARTSSTKERRDSEEFASVYINYQPRKLEQQAHTCEDEGEEEAIIERGCLVEN